MDATNEYPTYIILIHETYRPTSGPIVLRYYTAEERDEEVTRLLEKRTVMDNYSPDWFDLDVGKVERI